MGGYGGGYQVPAGYGDTFYIYAFDADALTTGSNDYNLRINILDGDFIARQWMGLSSVANAILIRNRLQRPLFSRDQGIQVAGFNTGVPMLPEEYYPSDGYIGFDLFNINKTVIIVDGANTVFGSQLAFAGVRRRFRVASDPMESTYQYYEKPYSYRFDLSLTTLASVGGVTAQPVLFQLPILDGYDFELRRIRAVQTPTPGTEFTTPTFKILLYNGNKEQVSNVPLLSTNLLNFPAQVNTGKNNPTNYFPTPGIMYRANSTIQFAITSLLPAATVTPVNYDLEFMGVRRYPCGGQGR